MWSSGAVLIIANRQALGVVRQHSGKLHSLPSAEVRLGPIVALHDCSSPLHQIHEYTRCLYF